MSPVGHAGLETIVGGTPPEGHELTRVLSELQGLRWSIAATAAAATAITVPADADGAQPKLVDTILAVIEVADPASVAGTAILTDRTATITQPADNEIQSSAATNSTGTGSKLLVIWRVKPPSTG